jgi:uncharacterized membrane protein
MRFRDFTKIPLVVCALALAGGLAAYPGMPARVPTHWGASGAIDQWAPKSLGHVLMMPALILGMYVLLLVAPKLDPKGANVLKSPQAYGVLTIAISLFFGFMQAILIATAYDPRIDASRIIIGGVGVLFIAIGNFMPRLPQNWTAGVRMAWTLEDPVVWKKTNRLGGVLFVISGVAFIAGALVLPPVAQLFLVLGCSFGMVGILGGYSYLAYRRIHESGMPS